MEESKKMSEMYLEVYKSWLKEGFFNLHRNRLDEAIECFEKVLILNPKLKVVRYYVGLAYIRLGKYKEAMEYFQIENKHYSDNVKLKAYLDYINALIHSEPEAMPIQIIPHLTMPCSVCNSRNTAMTRNGYICLCCNHETIFTLLKSKNTTAKIQVI